jgi:hypothetical protein
MSAILFLIISLFVQALALKVALGLLGQASAQNKFSTALVVTGLLNVALLVTAFVPFVGWMLKPLVWLLVIMAVYKIGLFKGVGVALVQFLVQAVLKLLLGLIGFSAVIGGTTL